MVDTKDDTIRKEPVSLLTKLVPEAKLFVLNTDVLVHDSKSVLSFKDNGVVIPPIVIEELDNMERRHGENARSAHLALRQINLLKNERKACGENIRTGLRTPDGGVVMVHAAKSNLLRGDKNENWKISTGLELQEKFRGNRKVIFVSKSPGPALTAESFGLEAQDYQCDKTDTFLKYGNLLGPDSSTNGIHSARYQLAGDQLLRFTEKDVCTVVDREQGLSMFRLKPGNILQVCTLDALRDPDRKVVALRGEAGVGKTVWALAVGLSQAMKKDPLYKRVVICRAPEPVGGYHLGYVTGDQDQKIAHWMHPITDNLEFLWRMKNGPSQGKHSADALQELFEKGVLEFASIDHTRGRTIAGDIIIIDDAQNLRPETIKTLVTRSGEGTKVILTGDTDQIDSPYLDEFSNGFVHLIGRLINEPYFCYLHLLHMEGGGSRSLVATRGAKLL